MITSRLCDKVGIKYPIIQAGMGPGTIIKFPDFRGT
jgi:NAD(P)H-dependent flavin oxidoreductase YrpB (nitropropane dioxygenase family)